MGLNDSKMSMNLISREELKEKLDRGDKFKLVNALGEWAFNAKHIPGSINISNIQDAKKMLDADDDIVILFQSSVYCKYSWISAFD